MTTIQLLFTAGLAATWLLVVFPMLSRDREAGVHGSAAGFERAMSSLRNDDVQRSVTAQAPPSSSNGSRPSASRDATGNIGPVAAARPTSMRAARRQVSSDLQLHRLRQLFVVSLLAVVATGIAAVAWQGPFWPIFVITTLATGGFVTVLRHRKLEADRAKAVIRSIRRDTRSFVGRPIAHDFEALPDLMAGHAAHDHAAVRDRHVRAYVN
jgi:hypothetical protein